jgi:hypothetical protein
MCKIALPVAKVTKVLRNRYTTLTLIFAWANRAIAAKSAPEQVATPGSGRMNANGGLTFTRFALGFLHNTRYDNQQIRR